MRWNTGNIRVEPPHLLVRNSRHHNGWVISLSAGESAFACRVCVGESHNGRIKMMGNTMMKKGSLISLGIFLVTIMACIGFLRNEVFNLLHLFAA